MGYAVKEMMTDKCENIVNDDCRKMADYMRTMSLTDARMSFRLKSKMIDLKAYYKGKKNYKADGYKCSQCNVGVETITHCLTCPGYEEERENKDLTDQGDLVKFFIKVMKKRSDTK